MLYREVDSEKDSVLYALIGLSLVFLSVGVFVLGKNYMSEQKVLGTSLAQTSTSTGDTSLKTEPVNTTNTENPIRVQPTETVTFTEPTVAPTQKIIIPTSTPIPVKTIPTSTPAPTNAPSQEEIVIGDDSEIIIENQNNELIIKDGQTNEEIITIPSTPTDPIGGGDAVVPTATPKLIASPYPTQSVYVPGDPTQAPTQAPLITTGSLADKYFREPTIAPTRIVADTSQPITNEPITESDNKLVIEDPSTGEFVPAVKNPETGEVVAAVKSEDIDLGTPLNLISPNEKIFDTTTPLPTAKRITRSVKVAQSKVSRAISSIFSFGKSSNNVSEESDVPLDSVKITYDTQKANLELDEWLRKYQFQVWALGEEYIAIHRNGITAITKYPIKLGISKLSFKAMTPFGDKRAIYYFDSAFNYLDTLNIISQDIHEKPIEIVLDNDELVYKIQGESPQFMFALIPVKVCRNAIVSAETREVKNVESCSTFDSLQDGISLSIQ